MFAKRFRQTWFAFALVAAVVAVPVAAHAAPAAPVQPASDVLAAVHAWWTAWSGVLLPERNAVERRKAPLRLRTANPLPADPQVGEDGHGRSLRISGDDTWKLDPDG